MSSDSSMFKAGDQVIIHGLVKATELNGCSGVVVEERRAADQLRYVIRLLQGKEISVKSENLRKKSEPVFSGFNSKIDASSLLDRCPVHDGVLDNDGTSVGLHLVRMMNLMRFVVAKYIRPDNAVSEFNKMPMLPVAKSIELNAFAVQHWDLVYPRLKYYIENHYALVNLEDREFALEAINGDNTMKCWGQALQQEFWFVGRDYEGTYVVPDSDRSKVYQIVGIMKKGPNYKQPGDPMSLNKIPTKMMITVVPWKGRLLYDSTILVPPDQLVRPQTPLEAQKLHMVVLEAIQFGNVINGIPFQKENQPANFDSIPLN